MAVAANGLLRVHEDESAVIPQEKPVLKHDSTTTRGLLWKIFGAALAIRWVYAVALFVTMGDLGFMTEDAVGYVLRAQEFADAVRAGAVHGFQWLGFDPVLMPLYYWLITPHALLFGRLLPLTYVLFQGVMDAATCVLIYWLAHRISPRYAPASAICAALNPIQIVLSGIFLTDTPFMFFVTLFLLGSAQWLEAPSRNAAILIAVGLGGALLIRILAAPWAIVAFLFLLAAELVRRRLSAQNLVRLLSAAAFVGLCVGAVLARNVVQYGAWSLTPQGGVHLALWVVPLVKEAKDRTPWKQTNGEMKAIRQQRFGATPSNPFEESRQYREIGAEGLRQLGIVAAAKAWIFGAVLNLGSPSILLSSPVYHLPRVGFFATPGASFPEKILSFLFRSGNAIHAWAMLIGFAGVCIVRIVQVVGAVEIVRVSEDRALLALFAIWFFYVLAINGPVASPKYRLPLEPLFMIATGAGICNLRDRWERRNAPAKLAFAPRKLGSREDSVSS
jgi:4-amino-4-deoxy-L-arabinose transferase-like glycosyltransferase